MPKHLHGRALASNARAGPSRPTEVARPIGPTEVQAEGRHRDRPHWMQGLPRRIQDWINSAGIQSDDDLADFFTGAAERGWLVPDVRAFALAWRQAVQGAARSRAAVVLVTSSSSTSLPSTSSAMALTMCATATSRPPASPPGPTTPPMPTDDVGKAKHPLAPACRGGHGSLQGPAEVRPSYGLHLPPLAPPSNPLVQQ